MKKIATFTILAVALTTMSANAQTFKPMAAPNTPAGTYAAPAPSAGMGKDMIAVYGHGNSKCSEYLDYQMKGQENITKNYQVWVNGFLSAYNTLVSQNGNVARGKKSEELMNWIESYCRNNPSSFYQRATIEMLRALESGEF